MATREDDCVDTLFTASTHDTILFFTNLGRVYRKKGYTVPESGRAAKGSNIVNILPLQAGEHISAMIRMTALEEALEEENRYLMFVTRQGIVKRMEVSELKNIRNSGIRAITMREDDELIAVLDTDGSKAVLLATRNGMAICFHENDVRAMGRNAAGVKGITLKGNDICIGAAVAEPGHAVLSVTENGYGKRTPVEEYLRGEEKTTQNRGGSGLKNYSITDKTGKVACMKIVEEGTDVLMISSDGTIIRTAVSDISVISRSTQGVRLMRLGEDARVIAIALMYSEEEAEGEAPEA